MKRCYSFVAGAERDGDDDDLRHRIDPLGKAERHRLDVFPLVDRICGVSGDRCVDAALSPRASLAIAWATSEQPDIVIGTADATKDEVPARLTIEAGCGPPLNDSRPPGDPR